jgi:hypothetical protein
LNSNDVSFTLRLAVLPILGYDPRTESDQR